jgi:Concanavalin A-like lectin/glucanases superfamily
MKTIKIFRNALMGTAAMVAVSCNDGIDPITKVEPGPDEAAPTVIINYPGEGTLIRVKEDVTPINIQFEVMDDIEIESIAVTLDGTKIKEFGEFRDYRRALEAYEYSELTNGTHILVITAKDLSGKSTSQTVNFEKVEPYKPVYAGEMFYLPFDGDYLELVSIKNATKVGSPVFADDAVAGTKAYKGAADAYLTFPTEGLLTDQFSAAFWYKLNASPDRSGILTIGPPDPNLPATPNNRKSGFRLFREAAGAKQRIKLNIGNGAADNWFDGGAAADIDPAAGGWHHIAFTIAADKAVVYVDGVVVSQGTFPGVDWTGCDIFSIASGAPRFTEWGHLSDQSLIDELRLFNKALTAEEVAALMD